MLGICVFLSPMSFSVSFCQFLSVVSSLLMALSRPYDAANLGLRWVRSPRLICNARAFGQVWTATPGGFGGFSRLLAPHCRDSRIGSGG